jgi:hypothetical protein
LTTILEGGVDGGGNETRHELRHHACLLFQHGHDLHLVLGTHLHHAATHVALHSHSHSTHLSTATATSVSLHLVLTVASDAPVSLVSANAVKCAFAWSVQATVDLVQHSSSASLSAVAHSLGASGAVKKRVSTFTLALDKASKLT